MSGNILNKIPMHIIQNKNYYRVSNDERVNLLQACYDNPLFQEEDGRFHDDQTTGHMDKKGNRSKDYHFNGDGIPSSEVQFKRNDLAKKKRMCILACVIIALAVITLVISLLVHFVGKYVYLNI